MNYPIFETEFHLQNDTETLTSTDGNFTFTLNSETDSSNYFVTMPTVGLPDMPSSDIKLGPYGVFASASEISGTVKMSGVVNFWDGSKWQKLENNKSSDVGIFVTLGE